MINWTLRDLEVFLTLADTGSFRRTADLVHLSQSAVSGVIARLEQAVGVRLIDRNTRKVALNEVGLAFHAHAVRVLAQARLANDVATDLRHLRRGRVRMATLPSLAASVLPRAMARFRAEYPLVELQLFDVLSGPAFDLVRAGQADFALTAANPEFADLAYRELFSDRFVLVMPEGHALTQGGRAVPWREALRHPHISMPLPTSVRQYTNRACLELGVAFEPAFELEHIASILALVRAGLGLAALPQRAVDFVSLSGLVTRPLCTPDIRRPIGLVTPQGQTLSPACARMVAVLESELAQPTETEPGRET